MEVSQINPNLEEERRRLGLEVMEYCKYKGISKGYYYYLMKKNKENQKLEGRFIEVGSKSVVKIIIGETIKIECEIKDLKRVMKEVGCTI